MTEAWRAFGFLVVMVALMPAYLYLPLEGVVSRRIVTLLAPACMAAYLGGIAFWRPPEARLQIFWLIGAVVLILGAAGGAVVWHSGTFRGFTFGLHAMAWVGLVVWWRLRPGEGRSFSLLFALAFGLQTYNMAEFGLCNCGAADPSPMDLHGSVCARQFGALSLLVPILVVTSGVVVVARAWRR